MKIAITGASGLIGRHIAVLARQRGHEVISYSRHPPESPDWRRFTPDAPPDLTGCDGVLNLAGESVAGLWTSSKRRAIRESRILATRRIVEAIQSAPHPPRVLLNASAVGIYGDTGDSAIDESAPHGAGFLAEVCEAWESEALRAATASVRVVLLRTGLVLSPQGGALKAMLPAFRLGLGGRLGNGRQWIPWIHMEDEAALALAALETDSIQGPLNATAPNPVRNSDFTAALAATLRRPALFAVPAFALRAALGGFAAELLESRRVIPAAAAKAAFPFRFPDLPAALTSLLSK